MNKYARAGTLLVMSLLLGTSAGYSKECKGRHSAYKPHTYSKSVVMTDRSGVAGATVRLAEQRRMQLRGRVSNHLEHPMAMVGGEQRFAPIQTRYGTMLRSSYGDTTTTMVPADWLPATGVNGPFDGGMSYTPQYRDQIAAYLSHYQLVGPMSVVQTGAGALHPAVISSQDVIFSGVPQRVSGSLVMERPGYENIDVAQAIRQQQIAQSRLRHKRYVATRTERYRSKVSRTY